MNMEQKRESAKSFTDLIAWREGHILVISLYKATKSFPKEEIFALTSQIRRAAVSVTSNVAEGFNRKTAKDKMHFYSMALGSVAELQNQILIARDIGYVENEAFARLSEQTILVHKLISGLIRSIEKASD
jgi:four helix bundle protein